MHSSVEHLRQCDSQDDVRRRFADQLRFTRTQSDAVILVPEGPVRCHQDATLS